MGPMTMTHPIQSYGADTEQIDDYHETPKDFANIFPLGNESLCRSELPTPVILGQLGPAPHTFDISQQAARR